MVLKVFPSQTKSQIDQSPLSEEKMQLNPWNVMIFRCKKKTLLTLETPRCAVKCQRWFDIQSWSHGSFWPEDIYWLILFISSAFAASGFMLIGCTPGIGDIADEPSACGRSERGQSFIFIRCIKILHSLMRGYDQYKVPTGTSSTAKTEKIQLQVQFCENSQSLLSVLNIECWVEGVWGWDPRCEVRSEEEFFTDSTNFDTQAEKDMKSHSYVRAAIMSDHYHNKAEGGCQLSVNHVIRTDPQPKSFTTRIYEIHICAPHISTHTENYTGRNQCDNLPTCQRAFAVWQVEPMSGRGSPQNPYQQSRHRHPETGTSISSIRCYWAQSRAAKTQKLSI